jgi:NAD(P)-dependent dehydrogenase (short-subunit alcohol dehydrogenase family)
MEIKDKVILITGAGSGMGAECARYFSEQGAKIIIFDINKDQAESVAARVKGIAFACNVSDAQAVHEAVEKACEHYKNIHVLINCAGIATGARILGKEGTMPLADFSRVIQINLIGTFNVLTQVAAKMAQQEPVNEDGERGVIINTASVAAFEGQIGQAAYSASKGGIVSLTLPAARDLAKFGIRVMTIAPGIIKTPMMASMPEKVQQSLSEKMIFPHRLGEAVEYAKLAQHIIENTYLNGSVIRLDAGIRLEPK